MFDLPRFNALRVEVGEEAFLEILEAYFTEVQEALAAMSHDQPREDMLKSIHFLKGSAMTMGFSELSGLLAAAEMTAKNHDTDTIDLESIHRALARLRRALMEAPVSVTS